MNAAAAPTVAPSTASANDATEAPAFPADTRSLSLGAGDFASGAPTSLRFTLVNDHHAILHVKLTPSHNWLGVTPDETALGPGERQSVRLIVDTTKARAAARAGEGPGIPLHLVYQRLYPVVRGVPPSAAGRGTIILNLPIATCPSCKRHLDEAIASGETEEVPEVCPYCYERLRPCPICGALNSWLSRRCLRDTSHVIRSAPDWTTVGGGPEHTGSIEERAPTTLSRRWSYPSVPPARREARLAWSAPVAAYGLVAAAAATADGDAHLFAFDAYTGAPLWDPYPLVSPVYPDRGGAAIANGTIFVATVEGLCAAVDAQRGTRVWEADVKGRVFGAVVACGEEGPLLVPTATDTGEGRLNIVDTKTGKINHTVPLNGPPDSAPTFSEGFAYVHDDNHTLTAIRVSTGEIVWTANCGAGFDSAPVVRDGRVFSANSAGVVFSHDAKTGELLWSLPVTNAPFAGTPAHDGTLLYLPADDGLHLVGAGAGRAVRRYPTRLPVRSAPVIAGGTLFFGGTDGTVYGAAAGRPLEKLYETGTIGSQIIPAPALADNALFVAATNGVLYALSTTGTAPATPKTVAAATPATPAGGTTVAR